MGEKVQGMLHRLTALALSIEKGKGTGSDTGQWTATHVDKTVLLQGLWCPEVDHTGTTAEDCLTTPT